MSQCNFELNVPILFLAQCHKFDTQIVMGLDAEMSATPSFLLFVILTVYKDKFVVTLKQKFML